ncbi:MAG: group II intron reverse transcriptase/maturase [Planctomycetota bacterium]|jgi:group II intron reverse transcriptase/maturase
MIAKILQRKNLYKAYRKVLQNKGASGVDGMEVEALRGHLSTYQEDLVREVFNGDYLPEAIRGVEIPKSGGKRRLLGIPTVVDRWLQQAVSQQLMRRFELEFSNYSYGFRPKRNLQQGVSQSLCYINDGYQDIVDIDLRKFFDEVPHYKILQLIYNKVKCKVTLRLIRKWMRAPIWKEGKLYSRRKGLPQGSPLSPLLSNILLDELDKYIESRGLRFIRYADDFSIYTKSKAEARRVGNEVYVYLRDKLCLPINREKSGIRRPTTFTVLGHSFVPIYKKGTKGQYQLVVSKSSWGNLKRNLKRVTKKTMPYSLTERISRINLIYQGWINNYRLASIYTKLKKVDEWLRNRLRYCIWHDWKKPERKRKNFIRLGIEKGQAYAWSRTRMGGWAVAQSPMLKTTITVSALKRRGYIPMIDYYHKFQILI